MRDLGHRGFTPSGNPTGFARAADLAQNLGSCRSNVTRGGKLGSPGCCRPADLGQSHVRGTPLGAPPAAMQIVERSS